MVHEHFDVIEIISLVDLDIFFALLILIFCAPYKQVDFLHKLTRAPLALLSTSPEVVLTNVKCD